MTFINNGADLGQRGLTLAEWKERRKAAPEKLRDMANVILKLEPELFHFSTWFEADYCAMGGVQSAIVPADKDAGIGPIFLPALWMRQLVNGVETPTMTKNLASCGTRACAVGWGTAFPWSRTEDYQLWLGEQRGVEKGTGTTGAAGYPPIVTKIKGREMPASAGLQIFFGITYPESEFLFYSHDSYDVRAAFLPYIDEDSATLEKAADEDDQLSVPRFLLGAAKWIEEHPDSSFMEAMCRHNSLVIDLDRKA